MSESTQPGVELELELAAGSVTAAARAEEVDFAPTLQVAEAFRSIGLSCLRQVTRNQVPLERGDPEAVHQMRVGLRRLRAAISIFGDLLGDAETELIKAELRWLTEQLGLARDYHVFLQESVGPMKASDPDTVELESLDSALQALHANSLASAKNAVASDRCRELLDGAALWLKSGDWTRASDEPRRELRALELAHFAKGVFSARVRKTQKHLKHLELSPMKQ